ncbi:hypothetical protein TNCV_4693561 [Trichonephila clavipes]|uniref:Uncharacterized protein n=1 Tax=Trichonephila clavipes TaxID=2585209 RepID=A0A8X6WBG7_TRICX|nr:hypothetical protein TNCV_4693561 [Trichonephila clavipes]
MENRFRFLGKFRVKWVTLFPFGSDVKYFGIPPGIVPEDWKLDAYLQLKPLRHARSWGKKNRDQFGIVGRCKKAT